MVRTRQIFIIQQTVCHSRMIDCVVITSVDLRARLGSFTPAVLLRARDSTFLNLSYLICELGMMILFHKVSGHNNIK